MRSILFAMFLGACASNCPEPVHGAPEPAHGDAAAHDHGHDHGHGHGHGAPAEGDTRAPLVHAFDDDDAADWEARFEGPDRDASQKPEDVVAAMQLGEGMTVADVGTGTGYFVPYLSRAVGASGRVLAVDIAPNMVRHVKARAQKAGLSNVHPQLALLDDPLLPAQAVDRILIVNTWHHIPSRRDYSRTLSAALRPAGSVWIVDFKKDSLRGPRREHKLDPAEVAAELASAGLTTRIDAALLPDQYIVIGTRPE